jgi:hypothetical protein
MPGDILAGMEDPTPTVDAPSRPPQRFRRTRIAVSVFFGVLTAALVVLWLRSLQKNEIYSRITSTGRLVTIGANSGSVYFYSMKRQFTSMPTARDQYRTGFDWQSHDWRYSAVDAAKATWLPTITSAPDVHISMPIMILIALLSGGSWQLWHKASFSLRTMLIATTLVAVVLGLATWTRH